MKNKLFTIISFLFILVGLVSCNEETTGSLPTVPGESADLGENDDSFGDKLENTGIYDGVFEGETSNLVINCLSGTNNAYTVDNNVVTFNNINSDSTYSISGNLKGNIIINVSDNYKFDLEMQGLSIISESSNPITILSGDKVTLTAKNQYKNYIYDNRDAIDEEDESLYAGAIYSKVDLEIAGKGELNIVSKNNNGIHSKDDIDVKNLTLNVACIDNALKGNDSVTIESGNIKLISSKGDCIKTTNTDISSKGNQRGIVTIEDGNIDLYAAGDGIDASYDVVINGGNLNIYTDKYSNYSSEVIKSEAKIYYIKNSTNSYKYSIKYYNSDDDYTWVDAVYHSSYKSGKTNYYYYEFPKKSEYSKLKIYMYSSSQDSQQEDEYVNASEYLALNDAYDTIQISNNNLGWTNYTTQPQPGGFGGGMNEGNKDKSEYSTKGMRASNQIIINSGDISIKSYDDSIHANNSETLDNNASALGNVTINGGNLTLFSNDDGIHADGTLTIKSGTVNIINSYEGVEGTFIKMINGYLSIISKDDGVNATASSGEGIIINGGVNYIYANGDGLDSNSKTSYSGIVFNGGKTVIISTSGGNSAIDTEAGYKYNGGSVVAIMPSGGMSNEATHCQNFNLIGTKKTLSLSEYYDYLIIDGIVVVKIPTKTDVLVIYLGSNHVNISPAILTTNTLDSNGVYWKE